MSHYPQINIKEIQSQKPLFETTLDDTQQRLGRSKIQSWFHYIEESSHSRTSEMAQGKSICPQAWQPKFSPLDSHGGRRDGL